MKKQFAREISEWYRYVGKYLSSHYSPPSSTCLYDNREVKKWLNFPHGVNLTTLKSGICQSPWKINSWQLKKSFFLLQKLNKDISAAINTRLMSPKGWSSHLLLMNLILSHYNFLQEQFMLWKRKKRETETESKKNKNKKNNQRELERGIWWDNSLNFSTVWVGWG